jgi:hypothetical protein
MVEFVEEMLYCNDCNNLVCYQCHNGDDDQTYDNDINVSNFPDWECQKCITIKEKENKRVNNMIEIEELLDKLLTLVTNKRNIDNAKQLIYDVKVVVTNIQHKL